MRISEAVREGFLEEVTCEYNLQGVDAEPCVIEGSKFQLGAAHAEAPCWGLPWLRAC